MAKFKNVSPLGALDVPALSRIVEAGETFEVPADLVRHFDGQADTFEPVKARAAGKSEPSIGDEPAGENGGNR